MRFIVYGPGGVGGTIAARLYLGGLSVLLIGRGDHGRALQRGGLRLVAPEGERVLEIPTAKFVPCWRLALSRCA